MSTTQASALDPGWLQRFGDDYLAAWNSHDADRLLGLMADDIVYDDAAWPTQMRGKNDVRAFLDHAWRAFPDMAFEVVEGPYLHPAEPKIAIHWRGTATFSGPLEPPGFAPTSKRAIFNGVDFHEYRDGKLARLRIDFDLMDFSRQVGLLPPRGSRAEKGMAAAQRLRARLRRH